MAPIGTAQRRARTEASLDKVEPISRAPPHSVVRLPDEIAGVDAALQHEIFDEAPDRIVGERSDDRGTLVEAATQPASDVVLAAPFPGVQDTCRVNSSFTGIEPQHYFAQAHDVERRCVL